MHNVVYLDQNGYRKGVEKIVTNTSDNYKKACYISFNDPHSIIIKMLRDIKVNGDKFIVVDASKEIDGIRTINQFTYALNVSDLFNVYLFLRNLIINEKIDAIVLDSISALIVKHPTLPLEKMLENLLLEIGAFKCDTYVFVLRNHMQHDVLRHLRPFIARNLMMY